MSKSKSTKVLVKVTAKFKDGSVKTFRERSTTLLPKSVFTHIAEAITTSYSEEVGAEVHLSHGNSDFPFNLTAINIKETLWIKLKIRKRLI